MIATIIININYKKINLLKKIKKIYEIIFLEGIILTLFLKILLIKNKYLI